MDKNSATIFSIIKLFTDFIYQSDGLEYVRLTTFVEIQTVDYKLVYCLPRIYINGCTLSFLGFYQS